MEYKVSINAKENVGGSHNFIFAQFRRLLWKEENDVSRKFELLATAIIIWIVLMPWIIRLDFFEYSWISSLYIIAIYILGLAGKKFKNDNQWF